MTDSIPSRLFRAARLQGARPAFYEKRDGVWRGTSYAEYARLVTRAAKALLALGVESASTVAILGFNRSEWTVFDLAAMSVGAAPIGIYTTSSASDVRYILKHSDARVVLVDSEAQWEKINRERHHLPHLHRVVAMRGVEIHDPIAISWESFLAKGDSLDDAEVLRAVDRLQPNQLATLIYTSGTTGPPKGVMLSHQNIAWASRTAAEFANCGANDRMLSYLPLSHIAEQVFSIYAPVSVGACVYFAENFDRVLENLKEVRPTVFFGVPRVWEKFANGIATRLAETRGQKKRVAEWAMMIASQTNRYRLASRTVPNALTLQFRLAEKLVFKKVKAALGLDQAHFLVTGAAPIARETLDALAAVDIVVSEVYGQSEDAGPTSLNRPGAIKFGSVGQPIPGLEVRIAADSEICVKGPSVFLGYYKDDEGTREALKNGWLHTGDLGMFDDQGYLSIIGRKKEILITSGGKNISPANIEAALKNHSLISEVVVIGDRRNYLTALIALNDDKVEHFLAENALPRATPPFELDEVKAAIRSAVDEVNAQRSRVEQIKKFTILPRNFTLEDGELTPTLKVKRRVVTEHFAAEIEAMYAP